MKLSIIIPNFNGIRFLGPCLDSLRKQTIQDFQVILVDNGSTDGSRSFIAARYPEITLIKFTQNLGFAAAVNAGIRASHTPYVMFLNNDTVLAPDCIAHLLDTIQKNPCFFSVGAHILTMSSPVRTDTSGDFYSLFGYAFCRRQGAVPRTPRFHSVFTNCGCAAIYRRKLLEETGLLDIRFFAYLEDVDLGFRARLLGYRNVICPDAVVFHAGSGTTGGKYTPFKVYYSARNNVWMRQKNLSLFQHLLHAPFFFCGVLAKYLFFRKKGLHFWYLKGILQGIRHPAKSWPKRTPAAFFRTEPWLIYGTLLFVVQYIRRRLTP